MKLVRAIFYAIVLLVALPLTDAIAQDAKIKGSYTKSKGTFAGILVSPFRIDGKSISGSFWGLPPYSVPSGKHKFILTTKFNSGFLAAKYEGSATVSAKLRPGRLYVTVGGFTAKSAELWIRDEKTGKRVSSIGKATECPAILKICH